jgi:hypothetical protein
LLATVTNEELTGQSNKMADTLTAASEPRVSGTEDSGEAVAHTVNVDGACENNGKENAT